jgi:hypothetical protein
MGYGEENATAGTATMMGEEEREEGQEVYATGEEKGWTVSPLSVMY